MDVPNYIAMTTSYKIVMFSNIFLSQSFQINYLMKLMQSET